MQYCEETLKKGKSTYWIAKNRSGIPVAELKLRRNKYAEFSFSSFHVPVFMLLLQRLMHINTLPTPSIFFVKESNTNNLRLCLPHIRHGWKLLAEFSLVCLYYICEIFILFILSGLDNRALKLAVYIDQFLLCKNMPKCTQHFIYHNEVS